VPSLEYQRERRDLYIEHEEGGVRLSRRMLDKLEKSPEATATEEWNEKAKSAASYVEGKDVVPSILNEIAKADRDLLAQFSGPSDPKFLAWLRRDYEEALRNSELTVKKLKESRP
jgi:hypothetical protein